MLDPGSVVREAEFATAETAASVPQRFQGHYQRLVSGERLTDEQREDLKRTAAALYVEAYSANEQIAEQYTGLAERAGVNPDDVVLDRGTARQSVIYPNHPRFGDIKLDDVLHTAEQEGITPAEVLDRLEQL